MQTRPVQTFHRDRQLLGQITLILQGGGALAAYQAGVYQALHESGLEPDWVIGSSIGAINAALIAGNEPKNRLAFLRDFWQRVSNSPITPFNPASIAFGPWAASAMTMAVGVPGFFEPNPWALFATALPVGAELASLYVTRPLEHSLEDLITPKLLNAERPRLTLAAAKLRTSEMCYFDSRSMELSINHVLASVATPPAFAAVRLDETLYWNGDLLSHTPIEAVFDDNPRKSGLIFAVQMWRPDGPFPDSIATVLARMKDLQYSSRDSSHIARQKQLHKLRHVIRELYAALPAEIADTQEVRDLASFGCGTHMHLVRLLAPPFVAEDHESEFDFSSEGIERRWQAGYADTMQVIEKAPWTGTFDPLDAFILHDVSAGKVRSSG